jgi:DNA-binding XRE family transcriptional regulator
VSFTIPEHSTKRARAERFGRELKRAMKTRDVGTRTVAEAVGGSRTSVMYWRTGRMLPRLETARKLAAALDWPRIETLALELRRKLCQVDQVAFVDDSGSDNRVFCSASCQRVAEKLRMGSTVDKRAAVAERRLSAQQQAVAAYCDGCEPSGRCVTADCALRPVSPLPLVDARIDIEPVRSRRRNRWEGSHEADSERQRRTWAGYTPEERQARIERAAAASKVARGLVPA